MIGNPGQSGSVPEAIRTAAGGDSATILVQPAGLKHMALDDQASLLLVTHVSIRQGPYGPEVDEQTAAVSNNGAGISIGLPFMVWKARRMRSAGARHPGSVRMRASWVRARDL